MAGLDKPEETIAVDQQKQGLHIDLVTHDVKPYFLRLLNRNGNLLDQIFSPLVVHTTPEHTELMDIARKCATHKHSHHYRGIARSKWEEFTGDTKPRVKPLLYVYRSLLCGIHLMRTGVVASNLVWLNEFFGLAYISELIATKKGGTEQEVIGHGELSFYEKEYVKLQETLDDASAASHLPDLPPVEARSALNDLLLRLRIDKAHRE